MKANMTPADFCKGNGSEQNPFVSTDGTAGFCEALNALPRRGGKLSVPCARYDVSHTIVFDRSSSKISGDVWGYSSDPNGVFESPYGTKIRLNGMSFPAISVGTDQTLGGHVIEGLGIQGDIVGMDTRPCFDLQNPTAGAGLVFSNVRTDQCEYAKLSFCGLGAAIVMTGNAELDACTFERCNADGCAVGIYFAPRYSFYPRINRCVFADHPFYGILADGRGKLIHNAEITNCYFVRNGGATRSDLPQQAALSLIGVNNCAIERNNFDDPGTFWYYEPTATQNKERQPQKHSCPALWVTGNQNRIRDNIFQHTKGDAVIINGDGNILMNNITDGHVVISGKGNYINGLAFTKPEAKLILTAAAGETAIFGVEETRILRQ